jgi:outer membrane cobalamin receptor
MVKYIMAVLILLQAITLYSEEKYTVNGYVADENGEALIGVNVYITSSFSGTITNKYGFYSLTLPPGGYELNFSFIGYDLYTENISLNKDVRINVELEPYAQELEEVVISADRVDRNIQDISMSSVKLPTKTIKRIPALMGEVDIIKSVQLLPGVKMSVEGSSGFYVRGGNADQNLILLDEATVYNPAHLFGFFSVFNGDAIKDIELYKGGISPSYGGRLSSVLDVSMKEGSTQKIKGEGGIGTISSRFTIEGPIVKDKASFIISARRTYADLFLPFATDTIAKKSKFYFYDLNAKINYKINDKNRIFLSGYFGRDVNKFDNMFQMNYGNATSTFRWNHLYNGKLFSNFTLIFSDFDYNLGVPQGSDGFKWLSHIIDYSAKNDYTFYLNPNNTIRFGIQSVYHTIKPGVNESIGEESFIRDIKFPDAHAIESAVFLSNEQKFNGKFSILYGLRFSLFQNIGDGTIFSFDNEYNVIDSTSYASSEIFNTYSAWEPRLGLRYTIDDNTSVKASYNRTVQYLHLASNSTATFPLDLWFMSNPNIKPQKADQVALGWFRNFFNNTIETSVEAYYKKMYNTIDYKDHAYLVPNKYLDGEIRTGEAESYGVEFMARKQTGKLTGWISYTYSRTTRDIPEVNNGRKYPAPYDKPHDVSVILAYELSKRLMVSANWVYSTAIPVTVPKSGYYYGNVWLPDYSERGSVRIPGTDYHRLDVSLTYDYRFLGMECNTNLSVYNVYNRHNAFAVYFRDKSTRHEEPTSQKSTSSGSDVEVVKLYLFPVVPSISFNFKF